MTSLKTVAVELFGSLLDGTEVRLFTLTNTRGLRARVMTYGATLVSLEVPDKDGRMGDIVLGHETLDGYLKNSPYFGSSVGRYANRIANGRFSLEGVEHALAKNNGPNHLHGGIQGFDKVVWKGVPFEGTDRRGARFEYLSRDGEEGYPGNLSCAVTYTLTDADELKIDYEARTDKTTIVNLTHHSYFNLAGGGDILGHALMLKADHFTPADEGLIPTGEIRPVKGTALDFTAAKTIGSRIGQVAGGYDHNYVLTKAVNEPLGLAARVYEPRTGRVLEVYTTEPGVQFYSGNFLDGTITGKAGRVYQKHAGLCLEPQHFPDSPNKAHFPSTVLRPGDMYSSRTVFKFSAR